MRIRLPQRARCWYWPYGGRRCDGRVGRIAYLLGGMVCRKHRGGAE